MVLNTFKLDHRGKRTPYTIMMSIRRPDDVIPFSELILSLPSFICMKPSNIGDMRVESRNIKEIPDIATIKTESQNGTSTDYKGKKWECHT